MTWLYGHQHKIYDIAERQRVSPVVEWIDHKTRWKRRNITKSWIWRVWKVLVSSLGCVRVYASVASRRGMS